jgi:hypothetical protein
MVEVQPMAFLPSSRASLLFAQALLEIDGKRD